MFLKTFRNFFFHPSIHPWLDYETAYHRPAYKTFEAVSPISGSVIIGEALTFSLWKIVSRKGSTRLTFESSPFSLVALTDQLWLRLLKKTLIKIIQLSMSILKTDSMHTCHFRLSFSIDRIQSIHGRIDDPHRQFCTSWCSEMLQYLIWK